MDSPRVVIVGAGISGLATAYFLSKLGIHPTLVEKSNRLGGLIQTDIAQDCQVEAGPDSYLAAKPAVTELAHDLGLTQQIIGSNNEQRRIFVVRDNKLVPLPKGMVMMVPGRWNALGSELFSTRTKLRFLTETLMKPRERGRDISISELVKDHFGKELLETVAEPLLSGVYGGDSENLSAESVLPRFLEYERTYGSLIRAVRRERRRPSTGSGSIFLSFRGGMQSLTDSLVSTIGGSARFVHKEAVGLESTAHGWRVKLEQEWIDTDQIVLACPAHASARLLQAAAPSLASELAAIPYSSAILATLVYERSAVNHPLDGFGFLVPRAERQTISATTWVTRKFPSRAPAHLTILRAFIVDPEASALVSASQEDILQLVEGEFRRLMKFTAKPILSRVYSWPKSMPQYVIGHKNRLLALEAAISEKPGLHLAGNAYQGVGIPDCVSKAKQTAKRIGLRLA